MRWTGCRNPKPPDWRSVWHKCFERSLETYPREDALSELSCWRASRTLNRLRYKLMLDSQTQRSHERCVTHAPGGYSLCLEEL